MTATIRVDGVIKKNGVTTDKQLLAMIRETVPDSELRKKDSITVQDSDGHCVCITSLSKFLNQCGVSLP